MSKIRYFTPIEGIEPDAVRQIERTASMPFVHGLAVMPDVHYGKGSTVGTVVATEGAIMPACVGVDIGCGMIAVRTSLTTSQIMPHLKTIREGIERRIPLGIGPYGLNSRILPSAEKHIAVLEEHAKRVWDDVNYMNRRSKDWREALGSLGGGNHFIEVCSGRKLMRVANVCATFGASTEPFWMDDTRSEEEVWVILHSGSRGVGNKTGTHWTQVALKQAKQYMYVHTLPDPDLAYLVEHSAEYWEYIKELKWCQMFALLNREEMMDRVLTELSVTVHGVEGSIEHVACPTMDGCLAPVITSLSIKNIEVERINCHHNFVKTENYGGKNYSITRKGAIEARVGMKALIPGSMGARSYIVEGLGNEGAFNSAPHGAGRRMSRTQARKTFKVEDVAADLAARGTEARVRSAIIDEAPGAYKDIDEVMENARELVRPTHALHQLISVKGD